MKFILFLIIISVGLSGFSQVDDTSSGIDNKYREDQFYTSITYNLINEKPSGVGQSGFSSGFHFGFIRDMPLNKRRNMALGLGLGVSANSYNLKDLLIEEINNTTVFSIIDEDDYNVSKNKFATYLIEVPFEFRWRTSTAEDYNFWRIYTGIKIGYLVYNSTKFTSEVTNVKLSNLDSFNTLQYGLTMSVGYSTWNFHMYYGLNSIFDTNAKLDEEPINMKSFKIGLMFYIL